MAFGTSDVLFRVFLRRDGTAVTLRFEVLEGLGFLGLRMPGWEDPEPSPHYEGAGISAEHLRSGRFVHVLHNGQRQSYALSRVTEEQVKKLPMGEWVELASVTEYGFRYLTVGDPSAPAPAPAPAPAAPAPAPAPKTPALRGSESPASSAARPAVSPALPPRQVPMAPGLAESALTGLDRDQAVALLREEMAKVEQLHHLLLDAQRHLEASRAREADLLGVLQRWQAM